MKKEGKRGTRDKSLLYKNNLLNSKHSQVTIFVIVAIIIVAVGVLIYMFYPQISSALGISSKNPQAFMQVCLEEKLQEVIENVSLQGGSLNPENYFMYNDYKLEYLCFTNGYYQPCVIQKPILKNSVQEEIQEGIQDTVNKCFKDLQSSFERRGYDVSMSRKDEEVRLIPEKVVAIFNYSLVLRKGDTSQPYDSIIVVVDNNLYELVSIANSIISMEARYGDAETTLFMDYYHDMKVEKKKQSDGTTIYILTDRNDETSKFQFASRSYAWPAGY